MRHNKVHIYGKHAVMEALLHAPHTVSKVMLMYGRHDPELMQAIRHAGLPVQQISSGRKARDISGAEAHQGVIGVLLVNKLVRPYDEFIRSLKIRPDTALALLGEIKDPHNVGAIIRTAAAFGVSGILMPQHNQAPITGAVVKVSAGMTFRIPIVEVGNVNTTLRDLKDRGFHIYGLEAAGTTPVQDEQFTEPSVFILGNEAEGIRAKTSLLCDTLLSIPIHPRCESLNVAASSAVTFYAWSRQHPQSLRE
jgi:23S rRNA (guanosine2251-2'-O)-methyltransferase